MRKLTFADPCIATAEECDFELGTWTFRPIKNFLVTGGDYAIIPIEELKFPTTLINELLPLFLETYHFAEMAQRGKTPTDWLVKARLVHAKIGEDQHDLDS